ncbi:DUF3368 domain-containing protein [Archaeoglobus neptunius]|uniref:DUF3368 domain-containing protein n=1 Tax=Archaeoglobus neptunius TaxID=2798580 RepID=UPI0019287E6A
MAFCSVLSLLHCGRREYTGKLRLLSPSFVFGHKPVGILIRAKREGKVECLKDEIEKLMKTGFWLNRELYERILEELGEL